jgi:hypothetical protein
MFNPDLPVFLNVLVSKYYVSNVEANLQLLSDIPKEMLQFFITSEDYNFRNTMIIGKRSKHIR